MENILITISDKLFFTSLLTLLSSIYETKTHQILKQIVVFDIGLLKSQVEYLEKLHKVKVEDISFTNTLFYEGFTNGGQHAYKNFCFYYTSGFYPSGTNVLCLDAGIYAMKNLKDLYEIIDKEDIFAVYAAHNQPRNYEWTHEECFQIMQANEKEKNAFQVAGGIFGFKIDGKFFNTVVKESAEYSLLKECVYGPKNDSSKQNPAYKGHRHNQSILSILVSRYNVPKIYDIYQYGEWRSYQKAVENNSYIYVHRRSYQNVNHLMFK